MGPNLNTQSNTSWELKGCVVLCLLRRALKAGRRYGYEAEFTGVGQALPHLHIRVGFCTQIAVFQRLAGGGGGGGVCASIGDAGEIFSYKLVSRSWVLGGVVFAKGTIV